MGVCEDRCVRVGGCMYCTHLYSTCYMYMYNILYTYIIYYTHLYIRCTLPLLSY